MAASIILKCRTKSGIHSLTDLNTQSTLNDLKGFVLSLTGIEYHSLLLKSGYPPTCIEGYDDSLLKDCGVRNGDLIIVEELKGNGATGARNPIPQKRPAVSSSSDNCVKRSTPKQQASNIKRKVVPANNSCLFTSIDYCLNGSVNQSNAPLMRQIIADKILSDSETYNEALLGRTPKAYADWIVKPASWGGGIELSILCDTYCMEIDVVDIQHTRIEKFGEKHSNRILLIYDGIHYDALYEEDSPKPRTIFPSSNDDILANALTLAESEKSKRQFTDAKNFKLKCLVCSQGLAGAVEANEHAKHTGHVNFGET